MQRHIPLPHLSPAKDDQTDTSASFVQSPDLSLLAGNLIAATRSTSAPIHPDAS